jgi:hypothetical protein
MKFDRNACAREIFALNRIKGARDFPQIALKNGDAAKDEILLTFMSGGRISGFIQVEKIHDGKQEKTATGRACAQRVADKATLPVATKL